jgi:hypothetical protein
MYRIQKVKNMEKAIIWEKVGDWERRKRAE